MTVLSVVHVGGHWLVQIGSGSLLQGSYLAGNDSWRELCYVLVYWKVLFLDRSGTHVVLKDLLLLTARVMSLAIGINEGLA